MFLGYSKDVLDMFDVGSKHVLKDVSVVFRNASEMFETCFRNVSKLFRDCSGILERCLDNVLAFLLKTCQACFKDF